MSKKSREQIKKKETKENKKEKNKKNKVSTKTPLFSKIKTKLSKLKLKPKTKQEKDSNTISKPKIRTRFKDIFLKESNTEDLYSSKEVTIIMLFSLGIGFIVCLSLTWIFVNRPNYLTLTKDLEKVVDTYYAIKNNYYGKLDENALVDSAVKGMVSSVGDNYTNYIDSDTTEVFKENVEGTYEGLGCTVATLENNDIIVAEVFDNSPAQKGGLQEGDIITKIDGEDYTNKNSSDMSKYVRNKKNPNITLTIKRDDQEKELKIKRKTVEVPSVTTKIIEKNDKKVGYLNISIFSSVTTNQFKTKLKELEKAKITSLIIDVRGNSGGYLSAVTEIAKMILPKDKVIYQLESEDTNKKTKDDTKEKRTYPIAILVNQKSASASEILAAAIKESYGGYVVGNNTYGKGTVQQTMTLPDGSMVKYTIQKWLTPKGNWINETGLEPTNSVVMDATYYQNPSDDTDNQLQTALELVTRPDK